MGVLAAAVIVLFAVLYVVRTRLRKRRGENGGGADTRRADPLVDDSPVAKRRHAAAERGGSPGKYKVVNGELYRVSIDQGSNPYSDPIAWGTSIVNKRFSTGADYRESPMSPPPRPHASTSSLPTRIMEHVPLSPEQRRRPVSMLRRIDSDPLYDRAQALVSDDVTHE